MMYCLIAQELSFKCIARAHRPSQYPEKRLRNELEPRGSLDTMEASSNAAEPASAFTTQPFTGWCPAARCKEMPTLCQQQFLFVISTGGRTGSTTLMNALNAIPNIWISGETRGLIFHLRRAFEKTVPFSWVEDQWIDGKTSVNAHYRSKIDRERVLNIVQGFIKQTNLPPSNRRGQPAVLGYKGIIWEAEDLRFVESAMPCSKFIINSRRDIVRQSNSSFLQRDRHSFAVLQNKTNELFAARLRLSSPSYIIPLEDFTLQNFTDIARWLGSDCTFKSIGHHNKETSRNGSENGDPAICE